MSTNNTELRRGNVRVALGEVLRDRWDPEDPRTAGYDPTDDGRDMDMSLGQYDETGDFPQLVIRAVSEQSTGGQSWKPDGSGINEEYGGRIDVQVYTGAASDVPENPELLASSLARHARDIVQSVYAGLTDPNAAEGDENDLLAEAIEPTSRPVALPDTEQSEVRWYATVEVSYRLVEPPED